MTRLRNGMMSYPEYYSRRNLNATTERQRSIDWFAETIKLCEKAGVPIGLFLQGIGGTNNDPNSQDSGSDDSDPSDSSKPKQPPSQ